MLTATTHAIERIDLAVTPILPVLLSNRRLLDKQKHHTECDVTLYEPQLTGAGRVSMHSHAPSS